jgi:hypothetical protein
MVIGRRSVVVAVTAGALVGGFGGSAWANQPSPAACWGSASNDGQAAELTLSSIASDESPGLSGYDVGDFSLFIQSDAWRPALTCAPTERGRPGHRDRGGLRGHGGPSQSPSQRLLYPVHGVLTPDPRRLPRRRPAATSSRSGGRALPRSAEASSVSGYYAEAARELVPTGPHPGGGERGALQASGGLSLSFGVQSGPARDSTATVETITASGLPTLLARPVREEAVGRYPSSPEPSSPQSGGSGCPQSKCGPVPSGSDERPRLPTRTRTSPR